MAGTLYLIRHGETEGAETKRYKGHTDVPLSSNGEDQMRRVGLQLAKEVRLDAIYASDLSRAHRSAELVANPHALTPTVLPEFRERHFGRWEGLTFTECREQYPEDWAAWLKNPLEAAPVGGETTRQVHDRVIPALEELIRRHQDDTFAIVSHGGTNRVILCHLLGMPLEHIFRIEQTFGAVNRVELWDGLPITTLVNGVYWK